MDNETVVTRLRRQTRRNGVAHAARQTPRRGPIPPPRRAFYRSSLGVGSDAGFTLCSEVSHARLLPSRRALCASQAKWHDNATQPTHSLSHSLSHSHSHSLLLSLSLTLSLSYSLSLLLSLSYTLSSPLCVRTASPAPTTDTSVLCPVVSSLVW